MPSLKALGVFIWCIAAVMQLQTAAAQQNNHTIIFASDTQEPLLLERAIRKIDHNEKATSLIFRDALSRQPLGMFILGDVVSLGYKKSKWRDIDTYLGWCRQHNVPVYAAPGNHEVILNTKKGIQNFRYRFPMYRPEGYCEVIDSVAVVLLNSNFDKMTASEITAQDKWYTAEIGRLDSNAAVRFIIVGCHHPPYTNSHIVKPSPGVQRHFVPAFMHSKKCVLFLSGHSHNFERFKVGGKDFLVIGGGGGVHQPLNNNSGTPADLAADYKPMFHYLQVNRLGDTLKVTSRLLRTDFSGFENGLQLTITR